MSAQRPIFPFPPSLSLLSLNNPPYPNILNSIYSSVKKTKHELKAKNKDSYLNLSYKRVSASIISVVGSFTEGYTFKLEDEEEDEDEDEDEEEGSSTIS